MLRTLNKRLDALTPSALEVLIPRLYAAKCQVWRALTLREYVVLHAERPPELLTREAELDRLHGVDIGEARGLALIGYDALQQRIMAVIRADADLPGDATPEHPLCRLYRRFSDDEVERLTETPEGTFYAALMAVAPAYVDVDAPMGEQGL